MTARLLADVAVVGAGPAGSVFATRMAMLGHEVTILEGAAFPRPRLGESLSPGVLPMLDSRGALAATDSAGVRGRRLGSSTVFGALGFPRVRSVATNWEGAETERADPRAEGLLVDRSVFDALLLEHARRAGARVLQPAFVRRARATAEGWLLEVERAGSRVELHTAFLADASGRASRLGARRRQSGPGTIALYGYFRGPALPQRPRIEARPEGWCWGVPIPDGTYNALVFLDPARVRGAGRKSLDELLKGLLEGSALGRDLVGAELVRPVRAADATPYVDEACVGPTRIRVGDAALALDPLSSSGVQKAIQTALSGAIVANTLLRRPEASLFASAFHRGAVERAAERHRAWSSEHYATGMSANRYDGAFWRARAAAAPTAAAPRPLDLPAVDCPLRFSAEAAWRDVPCLGEAFVEVQRALEHPRLDGPIAYLGGHSLTRLLEGAPDGWSARDYVRAWSKTMAPDAAASIARWLLMRGVLEPSAEPRLRGDAD